MSEEITIERTVLEEVLDSLTSNPIRAEVLLQDAMDEETRYNLVEGHILDNNGRCKARGCELSAPHNHRNRDVDEEVAMEWLKETASNTLCPALSEQIEVNRPLYPECPNCGKDAGFRTYCEVCGMPLGG